MKPTYEGPVCPECGTIAYAYQGGHVPGCIYGKPAAPKKEAGHD